jgi:hypothetical protein
MIFNVGFNTFFLITSSFFFVDVGFRVGGNTEIQYLTLQIHYAHALEGIVKLSWFIVGLK